MQSGEQDQIVFFESPTTVNVDGEAITTFTDASGNSPATPDFAMVISQKGNEAFESARTNATRFIRLRVRYRTDVKNTWRIKWNDEFYNITELDRSQRRKGELWMTAELVGAL